MVEENGDQSVEEVKQEEIQESPQTPKNNNKGTLASTSEENDEAGQDLNIQDLRFLTNCKECIFWLYNDVKRFEK